MKKIIVNSEQKTVNVLNAAGRVSGQLRPILVEVGTLMQASVSATYQRQLKKAHDLLEGAVDALQAVNL